MKPFQFQQFSVQQSKEVFRVGTDAVLLGSLVTIENKDKVIEVGSGTGIISLMIAQRNPQVKITAIDIDEQAVKLSAANFAASPFSSRMLALHQDFKEFRTELKFDLVVSNPPYFEENISQKDKLARQTITLNFENLIEKSREILNDNGVFSVIIPSDSSSYFQEKAREEDLHLIRKVSISGQKSGKIKRHILEFSPTPQSLQETTLYIEKGPRIYSDPYLELTKEFHVFGK